MFLRRLAAISLCGLLATNSVAYSSVCAILCASRAAVRGSSALSVRHHDHHSARSSDNSSNDCHAGHHRDMQQCSKDSDRATVVSAPCAHYQTVIALLDASRTSLGETFSATRLANVPVTTATPNPAAMLLQGDSPSPPQSSLPPLWAPTFLRI